MSHHHMPLSKVLQIFVHPCYVLEGCNKVSLECSILQAELHKLSQPIFKGKVFLPSDHLYGHCLNSLQEIKVFLMLRTPKLEVALHKYGLERQNPLLWHAGHIYFDLIWLAFWTSSLHWQVVSRFSSSNIPKSSQDFSQSLLCPACICVWECPDSFWYLVFALVELHEAVKPMLNKIPCLITFWNYFSLPFNIWNYICHVCPFVSPE